MVQTVVHVSQVYKDHARAAQVLSQCLSELGCPHAFIGGFAWSLLGSSRPTQDIDVLIEGQPDVLKLRDQIRELDKHFAEFGLKFYFVQDLRTDLEGHELLAIRRDNVLIETLEAGKLGLPKVAKPLFPVSVEEGAFSLFILHPAVLILTKLKRWAMNCDSTRPKTVLKCRSDEQDLRYIVNLLVDRKLTINFDDYEGKPRPQLLAYVRKYRDRFLEDEMLMEALQSAMQPQDWVDMAALQVEESDNMPPA